MKKITSAILVLVMLISCLAGCTISVPNTNGGNSNNSNNGHSYKTTWSNNSTHHWYDCEDENCSVVSEKAEHSMENDTCTVCGYSASSGKGETNTLECSYKVVSAPMDNGLIVISSVSENDRNYYLIDLGYAVNVPIWSGGSVRYNSTLSEPPTLTFSKGSQTQSTVEETVSNTLSKTVTEISTGSASVELGIEVSNLLQTVKGHLDVSYSRQWGTNTDNSNSTTTAYSTVESIANTYDTDVTFVTGGCGYGDYRLSILATCDIYALVETNIDNTETLKITYSYCPRDDAALTIEYSASGSFIDDSVEKITLPENYLSELELPKDIMIDGKIHVTNVEGLYDSLKKATAEDVIVLDNDINCTDFPWSPIENFRGTLLGNGYKIQNISYAITNKNAGNTHFGLFKKLSGAIKGVVIENLTIDIWNYHTNDEYIYVGGICAILEGEISNVTLTNAFVKGYNDSNEDKKMHAYVGGICGQMNSGSISSCTIKSSTIYGKTHVDTQKNDTGDCWSYTGGFVGYQQGGTISQCIRYDNTSIKSETVTAGKSSAYHCIVGGIVGYQTSMGTVSNCISTEKGLETVIDHNSAGTANTSESKIGSIAGVNYGSIS